MACLTPFYKRNEQGEWMTLPCSVCPECKKRRASSWSFRLMKESEKAETAYFVTLTYDTRMVPITKNGYMSLDKTDIQKFMKRLRKRSVSKIKYYIAGEYGSKTLRPHYHAIIFNANITDIEESWCLFGNNLGNIHIGNISDASVGYTLKYISKPGIIPLHAKDDRVKEFSLMSKGLGKSYINEKTLKWHHDSLKERCYLPLKDKKAIAMPRYYKDKIYSELQKAILADYFKEKVSLDEIKLEDLLKDDYFRIKKEIVENQFRKMFKSKFKRDEL